MKMNGGSDEELKAKFDEIDTNQGGYILFDEVKEISIISK
jgi:Ca2+-binding EF-hand superfamily protein